MTPFAAAALIAVMVAATLTSTLPNGFFVDNNGYEYNLVLAAILFALSGIGAGDWSLDSAGVVGGLDAVVGGRLAPDRKSGYIEGYAEHHAS